MVKEATVWLIVEAAFVLDAEWRYAVSEVVVICFPASLVNIAEDMCNFFSKYRSIDRLSCAVDGCKLYPLDSDQLQQLGYRRDEVRSRGIIPIPVPPNEVLNSIHETEVYSDLTLEMTSWQVSSEPTLYFGDHYEVELFERPERKRILKDYVSALLRGLHDSAED